ncbi:hypothetical protein OEV82_12900 [Caldibacillus thermolactis]|uniref:Uncharacterized protein n=1 Tax=Pallidibacillus thermolactis TaxID=251051 RepID=A0ABT2WIF3_9BACI|nr:hypothetical protein [Pallidibacillus thermolactis]MCU9595340.1 hypothetical protein [Pallidibacillus thermolactis]MCU9602659.1 hypothetical protein [Pallidibacillus thermolactis subsp. kokeshiiformis]MED1672847.1 hypothetical protein [Pallidibacillus thermolactis subsp. kokeshiiformis]
MAICPLCNGFTTVQETCNECSINMDDQGKISDYYDDYSPYMDIDLMKLEDGYGSNFENQQCVHLLQCPSCGQEQVYFVQE